MAALRGAGLVGARPDTLDRRRTVVFATDLAGERAAPLRERSADSVLDVLLEHLGRAERDALERSLELLLEGLRRTDPAARERSGTSSNSSAPEPDGLSPG